MRSLKGMGSWLASYYDKLITLVVFLGLVVSLLYLAVRIGTIKSSDEAYEEKLKRLTPKYPEAAAVTSEKFDAAVSDIRKPFNIPDWSMDLFVPETRVWCISCRRPIAFKSEQCPFCLSDQPDITRIDSDFDGITDDDEELLGLNPRDPSDAKGDADNDGFRNIDEYQYYAQTGKDIKGVIKSSVYPPIEPFLFIDGSRGTKGLHADPFHLLFKSHMNWGKKGKRFQLNTREGGKTHFVFLDDEVEGFNVVGFEEKYDESPNKGLVEKEISTLSLKRGTHTIKLTIGQDKQYDEYVAYLLFRLDDKKHDVSIGDTFELRAGKRYEVISIIDTPEPRVVIERITDRKKFTVGGVPGSTTE
ncbi:MAG: hypothetical protein QGH15_08890 [Kiritimatiellia bacterium]|jgi:hypothetical protein|nr:hypothetical protein [Kiritimatiellia bacterium]